jgi:membrane protein DedA with SNARE-associated domain
VVELFDTWIRSLGLFGYPLLGLAALIEYLFPPFPGDTISLLGGAYASRGERSYVLVLAALTAGSMLGIAANWRVGRAVGGRVDALPDGVLMLGITHAHLRRAQALMRTRGLWLLLFNRFLPSFRSVLFLAAGAANLPFWRVLTLGTFSALVWNSLLLAAGAEVGDNAERIAAFLARFRLAALAVIGLLMVAWLVRAAVRRARQTGRL